LQGWWCNGRVPTHGRGQERRRRQPASSATPAVVRLPKVAVLPAVLRASRGTWPKSSSLNTAFVCRSVPDGPPDRTITPSHAAKAGLHYAICWPTNPRKDRDRANTASQPRNVSRICRQGQTVNLGLNKYGACISCSLEAGAAAASSQPRW